jgi:O-antigen/teichoic acid export membrane protein
MLLFGGTILQVIYGAKYEGFGLIVGVLALSQLSDVLSMPANGGLYAMGVPNVGFIGNVIAFSVTITIGLFLVKEYGLLGVGVGLLVANSSGSAYRYAAYRTRTLAPVEGIL